MLQVRELTITMKKDLRCLIKNLTFSLQPGDKVAIIGEEGNGKSTLLKLLYQPQLVEGFAEFSGAVQRDGLILGYLSQELSAGEKEQTVYEFCCAEDAFCEALPGDIAAAAGKLQLSLETLYSDRKMKTFSGGEKVKIRLCLLTLRRPDVYLLDEPSNDLDIETLGWLEEFIKSRTQPVLYISHDEVLLERTANVIIHVEQLRKKTLPRCTVVRSDYKSYVEKRLFSMERQEQVAKKEREEKKKQEDRFRQLYQKVEHQQNVISRGDPHGGRLLKKKMKAVKSMEKRYEREQETMTELPDTEEAILVGFQPEKTFPQGKTLLEFSLSCLQAGEQVLGENLSLVVRGPRHLCIVGKNGAGKTTLLREIAKNLLSRTDIKAAYMPQDYGETVDEAQTPVEFLCQSGKKEELTQAKTYLGSMKYTAEECAHSIGELSGGQKAKLFFLKMILDGCNVLVLDEPTRNFSPLSGPVIRQILKDFPGAIISVSHDRKYIGQVCEELYTLGENGLIKTENVY